MGKNHGNPHSLGLVLGVRHVFDADINKIEVLKAHCY